MKSNKLPNGFLSVVLPVHAHDDSLEAYVKEVAKTIKGSFENYEIIIIDNGLQENQINPLITLLTKLPGLRLIRLSRTYSLENVIFAGIENAIGDFVVTLIPHEDPPQLIPKLVALHTKGYDIVRGKRLNGTIKKSFGSKLFYWYMRKFLEVTLIPESGYFFSINRRVVNAITRVKGRYKYVRLIESQVGFKNVTFEYTALSTPHRRRGLIRSINLALDIIISHSNHPLRMVSWLGLLAGLLNLAYIAYVVVIRLSQDHVAEGWTTTSLENASMFFFIFLILSIISEYIGRILEETRDHPSYHIMEDLHSNVAITNKQRRNIVN